MKWQFLFLLYYIFPRWNDFFFPSPFSSLLPFISLPLSLLWYLQLERKGKTTKNYLLYFQHETKLWKLLLEWWKSIESKPKNHLTYVKLLQQWGSYSIQTTHHLLLLLGRFRFYALGLALYYRKWNIIWLGMEGNRDVKGEKEREERRKERKKR